MRKLAFALLLLTLTTLTACGAAAPPTGNDSTGAASAPPAASDAPAASASAASEPAASSAAESPAPITLVGSPAGDAAAPEARATAMLSAQINKSADTLKLVNKQQIEWSDGSLGCPDPATMYMQVITPGYKLIYNDGTRDYEVHTDNSGKRAVWCENGKPQAINQP